MAMTAAQKAYLAAAEKAGTAPVELDPAEKAREIARLHDKLKGLDKQMKEVGAKLAKAKAQPKAEGAGAAEQHQNLLLENLKDRQEAVARLRELGETVTDPYVK